MSSQLITVIGALGGAVLGIFGTVIGIILNNHYMLKQVKIKRHFEIIEDIFETLIGIDNLFDAFVYDVKNSNKSVDAVERIKEIRTASDRIITLVRLYLPILKEDLDKYVNNTNQYWNAVGHYWSNKRNKNLLNDLDKKLMEAAEAYQKSFRHLGGELEKLVK